MCCSLCAMIDVVSKAGPPHACILPKSVWFVQFSPTSLIATESLISVVQTIDLPPVSYSRTGWRPCWEDARKTQRPGFRLYHGTRPCRRDSSMADA